MSKAPRPRYYRSSDLFRMGLVSGATQLRRLLLAKRMPQSIQLSERVRVWRAEDIEAWIRCVEAGEQWREPKQKKAA